MDNSPKNSYTAAGTDIEEVKKKNANSGMSYNEVKSFLAMTSGGAGTSIYSDTNAEEIKKRIQNRQ
ncbi:gamma-type small acid-soluble spore protein [Oceanobacillus piezotolerans]|uniref:Gamma-type small acid-soluble spore protein n=1 Tax=Oceanobacillus piezotolerans TaxID=2448030 RepID=A0A498DCG9_9BACI|nr:gamma-type small acid-soluble spore protein [Oceanobacillus piezotolerans]RLL47736.1 gamma-type small acid-soluble spore protein [Oceanobacillus piezotolerans]